MKLNKSFVNLGGNVAAVAAREAKRLADRRASKREKQARVQVIFLKKLR